MSSQITSNKLFLIITKVEIISWMYFLNEKSNALDYFNIFNEMIQKETREEFFCLRIGRGVEYFLPKQDNLLQLTLLNKMDGLKGRTKPS